MKVTWSQNPNNIHTGTGYLFLNVLRPLYLLRVLNDGLNPPSVVDPTAPAAWVAATAYAVGHYALDSNNNVQLVTAVTGTGTSGAAAPTWNTAIGGATIDNPGADQITWTNVGPSWVWAQSTNAIVDQQIRDSNGNIQVCFIPGTTGNAAPTWSTVFRGVTVDGGAQWINYGPTISVGSVEGALSFHYKPTLLKILADNNTAPIARRVTGEDLTIEGTLLELNMATIQQVSPTAAFNSGTDTALPAGAQTFTEDSFGGFTNVIEPAVAILSPRPNFSNPARYVTMVALKAPGAADLALAVSLKKETSYKVQWEGDAVPWMPAGAQLGKVTEQ